MGMTTICQFSFYGNYSIDQDFEGAMTNKVLLFSFAELYLMYLYINFIINFP